MSKVLYYIETQNRHNQILVFTNKKQAVKWCKLATVWNEDRIKSEIKIAIRGGVETTYYNIFPQKELI